MALPSWSACAANTHLIMVLITALLVNSLCDAAVGDSVFSVWTVLMLFAHKMLCMQFFGSHDVTDL